MASTPTRSERELAGLIALERGAVEFLRQFSRPRQRYEKVRNALEEIISERTLLQLALAGDPNAKRARRLKDAQADAVGK